MVGDLLSAAELAAADLTAIGIEVWETITVEIDVPDVLTADEVLAFEVPDTTTLPVLGREGLIMEGAANLLYSFPKTGKTELLTALVKDWVEAGSRVLYVTEEPFPNWKLRLITHGCGGDRLRLFYAWGGDLESALKVINAEVFDILIVDTLRNTVGYLEGKGDEDVARVIHPLLRAVSGKTSICSFHARKMPGDAGRDISGHHALYGAFDRALRLAPVEREGCESHRKLTVSGRCMYDGDQTLVYRQVEPGHFEVVDGAGVAPVHELVCLECGDDFTSSRRDARTCSDVCRQRLKRRRKYDGQ